MPNLFFALKDKDRFWLKVSLQQHGCWEWQAGLYNATGYGQFWLNGKGELAHRIAYTLINGLIPEGLAIDHLCRNRRCCNPAHLEAVTDKTNILRGVSPSANNHRKTHCRKGHAFSPSNTIINAQNRRLCKTCYDAKRIIYKDARRLSRGVHGRDKTFCVNGHKFTEENTAITGGFRVCIQCRRKNGLKSYYKKRGIL